MNQSLLITGVNGATNALPFWPIEKLLTHLLHKTLKMPLEQGDLDFIQDTTLYIACRFPKIVIAIKTHHRRFSIERLNTTGSQVENSLTDNDLLFRANAEHYLAMLLRKTDPDTLFFQRKLEVLGNTQMGLELKNTLDGLELETLPKPLLRISTLIYEALRLSQPTSQTNFNNSY